MGRQDALQAAYAAFTTRLNLRKAARISNRLSNPLPAVWATTGGGKSYFLDQVGELLHEDISLCQDKDMQAILHKSVSFTKFWNNSGASLN